MRQIDKRRDESIGPKFVNLIQRLNTVISHDGSEKAR
jgi:hypothetical protein